MVFNCESMQMCDQSESGASLQPNNTPQTFLKDIIT